LECSQVVRHSFLVRVALVRAQPFQIGEYSSIRLEYRIVEPMVASSSLVVRPWRCNSDGRMTSNVHLIY
jgi:hypothetical protein